MPKIPATKPPAPFWTTADKQTVKLYQGNVTDVLSKLPAGSVHCCVTSPPYWALRDYGTGTWEGGDPNCDHLRKEIPATPTSPQIRKSTLDAPGKTRPRANVIEGNRVSLTFKDVCGKCGAKRIDQQIGSEPSPDCGTQGQAQCGRCFVCAMVKVFREVRRVLRDDGCLWLNLGDSYSGGGGYYADAPSNQTGSKQSTNRAGPAGGGRSNATRGCGIKSGNLCGIPWRVALALQHDGWVLRQDIIWAKPSPMPESVQNRCTKAHEYVFLLTKRMGYYYDAEAIKESAEYGQSTWHTPDANDHYKRSMGSLESSPIRGSHTVTPGPGGFRNKRSVWTVSSEAYSGAHFATFPKKLIEPCILAGTSEHGCCVKCGAPWKRIVEKQQLKRDRPNDYVKRTGEDGTGNSCANSVAGVDVRTIGWEPMCTCHGRFEKRKAVVPKSDNRYTGGDRNDPGDAGASPRDGGEKQAVVYDYISDLPLDEHPVKPCVVMDPFCGSGTSCCVSLAHGRHSIGIDLSEKYLKENAIPRIEGELLSRPALTWLAGRETESAVFGADV